MKIQLLLLFTFLLSLFSLKVSGQTNKPCNNFECAYKKAENFLKQAAYQKALDNLDSAEGYLTDTNTKEKEQIKQLRRRLFVAIEKEKEDAKKAKREAVVQKQIVEQRTIELEKALAKNQKIIDALYFYKDKYALVYQNAETDGEYVKGEFSPGEFNGLIKGFYFIDKDGNQSIKEKVFAIAFPFDENIGFARVKVNENDSIYSYLDTLGNLYPLATNINQLDSQITALNLSSHNLNELSPTIFNQRELKILLLQANLLTNLNSDIGNLINLTKLDLEKNQLTKLPNEIIVLKNLKELNLRNNPILKEEQEKIKKLLPNCEIKF